MRTKLLSSVMSLASVLALGSCLSEEPEGLARAIPSDTTVLYDFYAKPLPDIPLPNDIATRADLTSATGLRVNASMVAPTALESRVRELIDELDGWGVMQPITIPFSGPLDVESILRGHRDPNYATENDVVFLLNVDPDSPELGRVHHLDLGQGNYPVVLKQRNAYGPNDPRAGTLTLLYEEGNEDLDGDGELDPDEDNDLDGVLDTPNYLPGANPAPDDLAARADAIMSFYEKQTNTLIMMPLVPLRERTTYAIVVTRRLKDASGQAVGSPFEWINHLSQTEALRELPAQLDKIGVSLDEVAFTFSYTTQSIEQPWIAVRDGLYGHGVQAHLGDEFPPDVQSFLPVRDRNVYPTAKSYLLPGELWTEALGEIEEYLAGDEEYSASVAGSALLEGQGYVDYFVLGTFDSPQLYERFDSDGKMLPLNDQSWPPDLDRVRAPARSEKVYFTLAVPRKEVSARGNGEPAPIILMGHGHTGNRFDAMQWSAYFCRLGFAVLSIDGPSHGINASDEIRTVLSGTLAGIGASSAVYSILDDRAVDQNADGIKDSGVDFWTAYLFHTRDVVRQYALDLMQVVRIVRGFDGTRGWNVDTNLDGDPDLTTGLAGDFDGDGLIDVGGDAPIVMTGGSLGGMIAMVMGSLEPELDAIFPIVGGGALSTIGVRSTNGGAKVGFMIRAMTPAYIGNIDESGDMLVQTYVANLLRDTVVPLATVRGVEPGDSMVIENLRSGEFGCGRVRADGAVHGVLASDRGDPIRITFYAGGSVEGGICEPHHDAVRIASIETFGADTEYQGELFPRGSQLRALEDGFGLQRGSPRLRRMQGLSQLVLDPGDPAVLAPHMQKEPLVYPGTGQQTGVHALMLFTLGDTSVPNSSGMAVARAAGLLEYLEPDARYGIPPNQVLIDTGVAESVSDIGRFRDNTGRGVMLDVENLSGGDDVWTALDQPRLNPPLRLGLDKEDVLGGVSGVLFALTDPEGDHGFAAPGTMIDQVRGECLEACTLEGDDDPCGCAALTTFDVGNYIVYLLGRYGRSLGTEISFDACQAQGDCADLPPVPEKRPLAEQP